MNLQKKQSQVGGTAKALVSKVQSLAALGNYQTQQRQTSTLMSRQHEAVSYRSNTRSNTNQTKLKFIRQASGTPAKANETTSKPHDHQKNQNKALGPKQASKGDLRVSRAQRLNDGHRNRAGKNKEHQKQ